MRGRFLHHVTGPELEIKTQKVKVFVPTENHKLASIQVLLFPIH